MCEHRGNAADNAIVRHTWGVKLSCSDNHPLSARRQSWPARVAALCLVLFTMVHAVGANRTATDALAITQALQLRQLSVEEAAKEIPVRLRGVVTFHDTTRAALFLHDSTDGTFVWVRPGELPKVPLRAGTLIEVEGVTAPGDFVVCVSGTACQLNVALPAQSNSHQQIVQPKNLSLRDCRVR